VIDIYLNQGTSGYQGPSQETQQCGDSGKPAGGLEQAARSEIPRRSVPPPQVLSSPLCTGYRGHLSVGYSLESPREGGLGGW
jgi:hypothetical protein